MKLKVAAKAIIFCGNKVLIMSDRGKWDFPGGGIESAEQLVDGLKRELAEETGFTSVEIGKVIHADEWFIEKLDLHVVAIFYHCQVAQQQIPMLSNEHSECAWILPDEIQNYDATPDTFRALEALNL